VKRFAFSLSLVFAIAALSTTAALAQPNLTGNWTVEETGERGSVNGAAAITQTANSFVGKTSGGASFNGKFCTPDVDKGCTSPLQVNGTWRGKTGEVGWLTVYVTPNGHSFNGSWGFNGRKESGTFVANKVLPPIKITTAGTWNVTYAGGAKVFYGPMTCTEAAPSSLCQLGTNGAKLDGKFRTSDKVRYKWATSNQNGWFSFWFADDGQSFNGIWGYGPETTPVMGRVVGQRQGPPARQ